MSHVQMKFISNGFSFGVYDVSNYCENYLHHKAYSDHFERQKAAFKLTY